MNANQDQRREDQDRVCDGLFAAVRAGIPTPDDPRSNPPISDPAPDKTSPAPIVDPDTPDDEPDTGNIPGHPRDAVTRVPTRAGFEQ